MSFAAFEGTDGTLAEVGAVVAAYLIGTFPSALLAGRRRGVDPTSRGSGNPGTTNVLRTAGRRAAALTLVGDVGKGVLAAVLGWLVGGHGLGVACGVAAVVGHVAPVTRRLRGGKGVATGAGMAVVLFPLPALAAAAGFTVVFLLTRFASASSLAATAVLLVATAVAGTPGWELVGLAGCAVLVVGRHADNVRRLVQGEEQPTRLRR